MALQEVTIQVTEEIRMCLDIVRELLAEDGQENVSDEEAIRHALGVVAILAAATRE